MPAVPDDGKLAFTVDAGAPENPDCSADASSRLRTYSVCESMMDSDSSSVGAIEICVA
jgi:hypothetical protein